MTTWNNKIKKLESEIQCLKVTANEFKKVEEFKMKQWTFKGKVAGQIGNYERGVQGNIQKIIRKKEKEIKTIQEMEKRNQRFREHEISLQRSYATCSK
jgi:hypothetical protein